MTTISCYISIHPEGSLLSEVHYYLLVPLRNPAPSTETISIHIEVITSHILATWETEFEYSTSARARIAFKRSHSRDQVRDLPSLAATVQLGKVLSLLVVAK